MKKRMISLLLLMCMALTLLPVRALAATPEDEVDISAYKEMLEPTVDPGEAWNADNSNPYGTGKEQPFLLNTVNELVLYTNQPANGNSGSIGNHSKVFTSDFVMGPVSYVNSTYQISNNIIQGASSTLANTRTDYTFVKGVAFDPNGTGRDDHGAFVGLSYDKNNEDYPYNIMLWIQNLKTGEIISSQVLTNATAWIREVYHAHSTNFFNITAGDYDGDGKETVIVVDTKGNTIKEYDGNGNYLGRIYQDDFFGEYDQQVTKMKEQISVSLATGDFDRDGVDELAVCAGVCNPGEYNAATYEDALEYITMLTVYKREGDGFSKLFQNRLLTYDSSKDTDPVMGVIEHKTYNHIRYADIAAGDVDGDGYDDLVIAGYLGELVHGEMLIEDEIKQIFSNDNKVKNEVAYATYFGSSNGVTDVQTTKMNAYTKEYPTHDGVYPQATAECVAINGYGAAEHVYILGTLYEWNSAGQADEVITLSRVKSRTDAWFDGAVAGNFDGNAAGREQLVSLAYEKQSGEQDYSCYVDVIGGFEYGDSGSDYGNAAKFYCTAENDSNTRVIDDADSSVNTNYEPMSCLLLAADVDDDGVLVKYVDKGYGYSDAQVQAVLQAAPYFGELGDYDEDFSDGSTSYSISAGYSDSKSTSNTVSAGLAFVTDHDYKAYKFSVKAGITTEWTKTYEQAVSVEYSSDFSAGGDDSVVLYRIPATTYYYAVYNSGTGNFEYNDDNLMALMIPGKPTYTIMDRDTYNEFAEVYNGKYADKISAGKAKALPAITNAVLPEDATGDPFAYWTDSGTTDSAVSGFTSLSDSSLKELGKGSNSVSSGWTTSTEYSEGVETSFGFQVSTSHQWGVPDHTAGFEAEFSYSRAIGTVHTTTKSHGASGTVSSLDAKALRSTYGIPTTVSNQYNFIWDFGMRKWTQGSELDASIIPIFGYLLTNITAAPPCPRLISADLVGDTSVKVTWEKLAENPKRPFTGYNVWAKEGDGEFTLLNSQLLSKDTGEYLAEGLKTNREYSFVVTTQYDTGLKSYQSAWSNQDGAKTPKGLFAFTLNVSPAGTADLSAVTEVNIPLISGNKYMEETVFSITANAKEDFVVIGYKLIRSGETTDFNLAPTKQLALRVPLVDADTTITVLTRRGQGVVTYDKEETDGDFPMGSVSASIAGSPFISGNTASKDVTFKATAASGYVHTGWEITVDSDEPYFVSADGSTLAYTPLGALNHIKAVFAKVSLQETRSVRLTATTVPPQGRVIVTDEAGTVLTPVGGELIVPEGTRLTFTAEPEDGFDFDYWIGLAASHINPCTVTVNEDLDIEGYFYAAVLCGVNYSASAGGQVTATRNGISFTSGDKFPPTDASYVFKAEAEDGYVFDRWTVNGNDSSEKGLILSLSGLSEEIRVKAEFIQSPTPTPTAVAAPTAEPAGGVYHENTLVELSAEEGAVIYYTLDGSLPTENSILYSAALYINTSAKLLAIAVKDDVSSAITQEYYTIAGSLVTIEASGGSNVTVSPSGSILVPKGTDQTFYFTPDDGYIVADVFVDGVSVGAGESYTFSNVNQAHSIEATAKKSHQITLAVSGPGSAAASQMKAIEGTVIKLSATAEQGYSLKEWVVNEGGVSISDGKFTMPDSDVSLTAVFGLVTHTITATTGVGGSIEPIGDIEVMSGGSRSFSISADPGYVIQDVLVDGVSVGAPESYTFNNIDKNHTIDLLTAEVYPITVLIEGGTGTASVSASKAAKGTKITLSATPDEGYRLVEWRVNSGGVCINNGKFTMPAAAVSLTAVFEHTPYKITAEAGTGGKITPSGTVAVGASGQTFTMTADDGYTIADVLVDNKSVGARGSYTFEDVEGNHTITVSFDRIRKPGSTGGGGGTSPAGTTSAGGGGEALLTAIVSDGGGGQRVDIAVTIDDNTVIASPPSASELQDIIDGAAAANHSIHIDLSPLAGKYDTAIIPQDILAAVANSDVSGLSITMPDGRGAHFDKTALDAILSVGTGDLKLSVREISAKSLTGAQKRLVGDALVIDLTAYIGTKQVRGFGGGLATVSIPVDGEPMEHPIVWRMTTDADGKVRLEAIECVYNPKTDCYEFQTGSFSEYVLGNYPFTDTPDTAWYYEDAVYAYVNGLFAGVTATTFSPDTTMTRGMLVTVLWRMENSPAVTDAADFSDTVYGVWYADAVSWAAANDIAAGYGNGRFGPNDPITREQMAAILYRYAQYKAYDTSVGEETNILSYKDALDVSEYAVSAIQWACGAGLMQGSDGNLMPKGAATRAQVAAILHRFNEWKI